MNARTKADACFRLARSTTFEGERANAVEQGIRIAKKAGLSLDLFDIPGRVRATAPPPPKPAPTYYGYSPTASDDWIMRDIQFRMRAELREAVRRQGEELRAENMRRAEAFRARERKRGPE